MPARQQNLADSIELAAVSPCFDRQSLADEIERWLERDTVDARLRVKITRTPESLSFAIRLGEGTPLVREFAQLPQDCAGERSALALSIALAIDALAPRTEPPRPERRWLISAGISAGANGAGRPVLGLAAAVEVTAVEPVWLELSVFGTEQKDAPIRTDGPATYDDSRFAARLGGCAVASVPSRVDAAACAGPFVGAATITGHGLLGASPETRVWWGVGMSLALHVRFSSHVGAHLGVDGTVSPQRGAVQALDAQGGRAVVRDLPGFSGLVQLGPSFFF